jgi:putative oxidoreductase
MKPVRTAARALLGTIFVVNGVRNALDPDARLQVVGPVAAKAGETLAKVDPRLPTDPRTLVRLKAGADVAAGLLLATGHATRPAAAVLAAGLVPGTIADRPFRSPDFLKDLGLLGGLLLAAVDTEGQPGLRYRTTHAIERSQRSARRALRTARREARIAARSASAARKFSG